MKKTCTHHSDCLKLIQRILDREATPEEDVRPPQPDGEVFELTDDMALPDPPPAAAAFHKVDPQDDLEFTEAVAAAKKILTAALAECDETARSE